MNWLLFLLLQYYFHNYKRVISVVGGLLIAITQILMENFPTIVSKVSNKAYLGMMVMGEMGAKYG